MGGVCIRSALHGGRGRIASSANEKGNAKMSTIHGRVFGGLAAMVMVGSAAVGIAQPASAATAYCKASNSSSSAQHTITESSPGCNQVRARASHLYASGAKDTTYGVIGPVHSTVYKDSGVAL